VFTYKDKPIKVQQVARELGVHYVLEGNVQREGDRLRITAQLVDATTGHHIWAESYDRDVTDLFSVQDEVTQMIAANLGSVSGGQVDRAVAEQARRKRTDRLEAYEYYMLGHEHKYRFAKDDMTMARQMAEKAISLDPGYSRAYALLAWTHFFDWWWGWSDSAAESAERAFENAKMAVSLDKSDSEARRVLAGVHFFVRHEHEEALAEFERGFALNPNDADLLMDWAWLLAMSDRMDEGIELMQKAMRLNPHHPEWYLWGLGMAYYTAGQSDEAIGALKRMQTHHLDSRAFLAASYAQTGRMEEAEAEADQILKLNPAFSVKSYAALQPYKNRIDRDYFIDGLRKAGLPE
jgi:adenylate cyclase